MQTKQGTYFHNSNIGNPPNKDWVLAAMQNRDMYKIGREEGPWDQAARVTHQLGPNYDYSVFSGKQDSRGHSGDIGKLPWHPTYSDQSAYKGFGPQGIWVDNNYVMSDKAATDGRLGELQWMLNNGYNDGDQYYTQNPKGDGSLVQMKPQMKYKPNFNNTLAAQVRANY